MVPQNSRIILDLPWASHQIELSLALRFSSFIQNLRRLLLDKSHHGSLVEFIQIKTRTFGLYNSMFMPLPHFSPTPPVPLVIFKFAFNIGHFWAEYPLNILFTIIFIPLKTVLKLPVFLRDTRSPLLVHFSFTSICQESHHKTRSAHDVADPSCLLRTFGSLRPDQKCREKSGDWKVPSNSHLPREC